MNEPPTPPKKANTNKQTMKQTTKQTQGERELADGVKSRPRDALTRSRRKALSAAAEDVTLQDETAKVSVVEKPERRFYAR